MTETTLNLIAFLKLLTVSVFALFYSLGGTAGSGGKWIRRFIGPAWMMAGIFVFSKWQSSWSYWYLFYWLALTGSLHLGYGADETGEKIKRRAMYGIVLGISALPLAIVTHAWLLFGFHLALCVGSSVILGVWNPLQARAEESVIGFLSTILVLFMI